ncbi:hypothetical protein [Vagococcus sp. WN89Y]|uniref:hypothetical protein n=1 Tax=Vagococcus sp. WN89Y TaxID=3457258 RepID=UPI003FCDD550
MIEHTSEKNRISRQDLSQSSVSSSSCFYQRNHANFLSHIEGTRSSAENITFSKKSVDALAKAGIGSEDITVVKLLARIFGGNKNHTALKKEMILDFIRQALWGKNEENDAWAAPVEHQIYKRKLSENDSGTTVVLKKLMTAKNNIKLRPQNNDFNNGQVAENTPGEPCNKLAARREAERRIQLGFPWKVYACKAGLKSDEVYQLMRFATTQYAAQEVMQGKPYHEVADKYQLTAKYTDLLEMISARALTDRAYTNSDIARLKNDPYFTVITAQLIEELLGGGASGDNEKVDPNQYAAEVQRVRAGESCTKIAHSLNLSVEDHNALEKQVAKQIIAPRIKNGTPFASAVLDADINFKGGAMIWLVKNMPLTH